MKISTIKLMQEERYLNAEEILALGFAHKIEEIVFLDQRKWMNEHKNMNEIRKLQLENEQLKKQLEKIENEKIEQLVKQAPEKIQPSLRLLAKINYQEAENLLKEVKQYQTPSIYKIIQDGKHTDTNKAGWSLEDWRKKDPEGLKRLKFEEPELFENLLKNI